MARILIVEDEERIASFVAKGLAADGHRATVGERELELSAREFSLAETLMVNAGQVLSREQLLDQVWGFDFDPGSNVVDVYIGYLRKKFGPAAIATVRGMGYRFNN